VDVKIEELKKVANDTNSTLSNATEDGNSTSNATSNETTDANTTLESNSTAEASKNDTNETAEVAEEEIPEEAAAVVVARPKFQKRIDATKLTDEQLKKLAKK